MFELHLGDCLEVMKEMESNSVHSIVTDPPYGLSDRKEGLSDIFFTTLFNVFFPEFNKRISNIINNLDLITPFNRIPFLNSMNRSIWVEPSVTMIKGSIDFYDDFVDWNKEIEDTRESSEFIPDRELMDIRNSHRIKNGNNFFLKIRNCVNSSLGNSSTCGFTEFGFGTIGMAVVIPFDSCFASFLRSLPPCDSSGFADIVRLLNDPFAFSKSPSSVMTSNGTELRTILTLDTGNGSCKLDLAASTNKFDAVFEVCCPQDIGTITGTSSLSSMFKSYSVSLVDSIADWAFSINFHKFMVPYINQKSSGFMGNKWDYDVPSVETWQEALRVLKPGGTALIFAGSRTQHRMAVNVEDAGFILKDNIMWIYGSGFPKSTDISKQIDKKAGAEREVIGISNRKASLGSQGRYGDSKLSEAPLITTPATPAAQLWNGYGTALKPAYEPIIVAMKPNDGTYANNALKHGVAGLNIDGCRIEQNGESRERTSEPSKDNRYKESGGTNFSMSPGIRVNPQGRFPANIIHDGSEEVISLFPKKAGASAPVKGTENSNPAKNAYGEYGRVEGKFHNDSGSAARFFYCAKASKTERNIGLWSRAKTITPHAVNYRSIGNAEFDKVNGNYHPTVKPLALMEYLCKLVQPPSSNKPIILDPFMGSNTTGLACKRLGIDYIGIEKIKAYFEIAERRINDPVQEEIEEFEEIEYDKSIQMSF